MEYKLCKRLHLSVKFLPYILLFRLIRPVAEKINFSKPD